MDLSNKGFVQSELDKCILIYSDAIFIVFIYDTIHASTNTGSIEEEIKSIRIWQDKQCHSFELRDEVKVGDFLAYEFNDRETLNIISVLVSNGLSLV